MILQDFIVKTPLGLYCKYGEFYLDPQLPVSKAVISHAHGDHAKPNNQDVFCTANTAAIMKLRFKKNAAKLFFTKDYHQEFSFNSVKVSFLPAGHILGSALVKMEYQDCIYLFTGDYKLQEDDTCEPLALCKADVLITETTFANPEIKHPNPYTEIEKLNEIDANVMIGVYSLGKAQRITSLINKICPQKNIMLHYSIFPIHQIYQTAGFILGNFKHYDRKVMKQNSKNNVYLVPPLTFNSYQQAKDVVKIFASGWENLQKGNHIKLYISDHVDWQDILKTIDFVQPKEVWTIHGDGSYLKNYFRDQLKVSIL